MLLSFNRNNKLDDSYNKEEEKNSDGENKGDQYDQFEANVNKSGHELGEGNVCVAEICGVDDCERELEENSKATFDIKDHECNMIPDTEDNIGIIFKLEGNDVKVSLRGIGSYMKFNKECLHKGYKCGMGNIYLTAQLFAAPAAGQKWHRLKCMNISRRYKKKQVEGEQFSILSSIRNEIQENWDNPYMNAKYNLGSVFQGVIENKKKTRKIKHEHFPKIPYVQQLIKIFENLHNDMRVTEVWFLKNKDKCDGFEDFHYDYKNIGGRSNYVSYTVNVNLGKLNEANDIATMIILPSNEAPSVLSRSRRQKIMQKLSLQEKEEINQLPKEDLHRLKSGMMYTKDINYYMDYLQEQDEIMCRKIHKRKPSLFFNIGFITFNSTNKPKCNTMTPRCARGKSIFNMRYVFREICGKTVTE
jgi:hypothetical protein